MMKSEPRPFASLSSGLLARKGAARPAMRPQGFGQMGSGLEDLGWNDMGFEPPRPALHPVGEEGEGTPAPRPNPVTGLSPASPVHAVQDELVQRLAPEPAETAFDEEIDETAEPVPADAPPIAEVIAAPAVAEVAPVSPLARKPEPRPEPVAEAPRPVPVAAAPVAAPRASMPRSRAATGKAKAAFTLRLDTERHLKLRLACAVTGSSAQQLVTRALDALLGTMPELDAMASKPPERHVTRG